MRHLIFKMAGFIALLVALSLLAFCLTGCGNKSATSTTPAAGAGTGTAAMGPPMPGMAGQGGLGPGGMAGPPGPGMGVGPGGMATGPGSMASMGMNSPMSSGLGMTSLTQAATTTTTTAPDSIKFGSVPLKSPVKTVMEKGLTFLGFKYQDLQKNVQVCLLPKEMSQGEWPYPDWINTFDMYRVGDSVGDAQRRAAAAEARRKKLHEPPHIWEGVRDFPLLSPRSVSSWPSWALPRQTSQYTMGGMFGRPQMPGMIGAAGRSGVTGMAGTGIPSGLPGNNGLNLGPGGMMRPQMPGATMPGLPGATGLPQMPGFAMPNR